MFEVERPRSTESPTFFKFNSKETMDTTKFRNVSENEFTSIIQKETNLADVSEFAVVKGENKTLIELNNIEINEPVTIVNSPSSFKSIRFINCKIKFLMFKGTKLNALYFEDNSTIGQLTFNRQAVVEDLSFENSKSTTSIDFYDESVCTNFNISKSTIKSILIDGMYTKCLNIRIVDKSSVNMFKCEKYTILSYIFIDDSEIYNLELYNNSELEYIEIPWCRVLDPTHDCITHSPEEMKGFAKN
jgi:hypothetical protein